MDKKTESRKQKLAYFWTAATVVASIIIGAGVITHSAQVLPLFLAIVAILFGPVCGALYLMEIKKGVLAVDDDE